jgi:outer membrane protein
MKSNILYQAAGIVMIGILTSTTLSAQEVRTLSLTDAIDLSLKNSGQLKISQARIDEAQGALREAKERRLPDLKASGSYLRVNNPTVDLKSSNGGEQTGTGTGSAASSIKVDQAMYGMANLSLPIFSGFRINYGIESSKYLAEAAKLDAETDKEEIIQNALNAYSNLYKAEAAVGLMKENLKSAQERSRELSNLEKNGLLARNDLLKADLQTSNIELALMDAENNLALATINMDLMLGLDKNTILKTDATGFTQPSTLKTVDEWEATALQSRKDMAALNLREKAAAAGVKATKGEYYPGIALTGGYVALNVPNFVTVTNAINAGIGLQYNLGALWKTGAKVQQAKARVVEIQANEGILTDAIRLQVNQAYQNYSLSVKKISVYKKAIDQAEENYKITKNKYDNNLSTTTELLDADLAQLQARLNFANAKADASVSYSKLLQVAGVLNNEDKN